MNGATAISGDASDRVDMRDPGWRADPHPLPCELRGRSDVAHAGAPAAAAAHRRFADGGDGPTRWR